MAESMSTRTSISARNPVRRLCGGSYEGRYMLRILARPSAYSKVYKTSGMKISEDDTRSEVLCRSGIPAPPPKPGKSALGTRLCVSQPAKTKTLINKEVRQIVWPSEHFVFDISVTVQRINFICRSVFVMAYIHWFPTRKLNSYLAIIIFKSH